MENQNNELQSCLLLKNLYFNKINFVRDTALPTTFTTKFSTQFKDISLTEVEVKLICKISSNTAFALDVELIGCFENNEEDPTVRDEINKVNTLAIMFPYLRAEVSLVTAQPNFPTIDLPVVNINALLEGQGKIVGERK